MLSILERIFKVVFFHMARHSGAYLDLSTGVGEATGERQEVQSEPGLCNEPLSHTGDSL